MHLKSLTLKGFKSFADKAVLTLEPGITAVVGPNGSGKSNISDAVLWVLGERNAKNLRGQAMEDVIFAGSSARRATSVAEVELVLDNSDGTLPIDFNEVVIGRRMYRTGESEYLINGSIARRMDVLDILHDSGLGAGTHSIISQGSIDHVLQSKPEDRRNLIEEAAGVLKHKERLAKSARKLERMESHVERVSDIVAEVSRQLGPLERKAKRAKRYGELAGELSHARLLLAVDDLRDVQSKYDSLMASEASLQESLEAKKSDVEAVEAEMQELSARMREQAQGSGELSRQQRVARSAADRMTSAIAVARDRRRAAMTRAAEIEMDIEGLQSSLQRLNDALAAASSKLEASSAEKASAEAHAEELSKRLSEAADARAGLDKELASLKDEVARIEKELTEAREQKALAQESLTQGMAHLKVLDSHTSELEIMVERSKTEARSAEADALALEETLTSMEAKERDAKSLVAACSRAREAAQLALEEANAQEQSIKAQIAALDAIEASRSSGDDARAWISQHQDDLALKATPLAHVIRAKKGYESLVELLLGKDVDALALDGHADVRRAAGAISGESISGEVTLVMLDDDARADHAASSAALRGAHASNASGGDAGGGTHADASAVAHASRLPLIETLSFPDRYADAVSALLGDVVICENLEDALAAHAEDDGTKRFVVADGSIVWPTGKVTLGLSMLDEDQGTLARIRQLDELRTSLVDAVEMTSSAQEQASAAESALVNAQEDSLKLSEKLAVLRGNVQSARNLAQLALDKLASSTRELDDAAARRAEAEKAINEAKPDVARLDEKLTQLQSNMEAVRASQENVTTRLAPLSQLSDSLTEELQQARLAAAKSTERKVYDEMMLERHKGDLSTASTQLETAKKSLHVKRTAVQRLDELLLVLEELEGGSHKLAQQLEEAQAAQASSTSSMHAESEELRKRAHGAQSALDEINERLSEARIEKARLEMQVQSSVAEIVEGCSVPLEQALQMPPLDDRENIEQDVARLERSITNLGTINPDAAQEYDELKERYDYLAGQLADLEHASRALTKIDRMIESRMKDDFVNTYKQINDDFQKVFEMLFPGGKANLSLVDPEDLENTGVEVNAQPAGKRITKMSLMSGGEKSLTALALLFALYRTRPTPFYILDEVEAALDDSNLRRLTGFIDAMRDSTQLIMITHQRRTMEMADVLFGVSMGSDGVTKVISQKLENALRHAK